MCGERGFDVAVFGLTEAEHKLLKNVAWQSTQRTRGYSFGAGKEVCDIHLVDGESPRALDEWRAARAKGPVPALIVTAECGGRPGQRCLRRPIVSAKLLALLDEITIQDLHFLPELEGRAGG